MKTEILEIITQHKYDHISSEQVVSELLDLFAVSGSTFTIDDMKKAFMAGADKKNWTKIYLTGVVSGQDYELAPIFEKWFEYYR